jgi:methylenetetrahydrofolate dehydrogenase (NADP+)/methenyltetrahydrofolate cyclohydrolase
MAQILDGLKISNEIKQEIKTEVDKIKASGKRIPHLSAIIQISKYRFGSRTFRKN